MTRQELIAERDRLADEALAIINAGNPRHAIKIYRDGFNAAIKLMLEREKVLRESMKRAADICDICDGAFTIVDEMKTALAQVPEWDHR